MQETDPGKQCLAKTGVIEAMHDSSKRPLVVGLKGQLDGVRCCAGFRVSLCTSGMPAGSALVSLPLISHIVCEDCDMQSMAAPGTNEVLILIFSPMVIGLQEMWNPTAGQVCR